MKIGIMIFVLFVGFMIIGSFGGIYFSYLGSKQVLIDQTNDYFDAIVKSRANHVESFLEMMRIRIVDFSSDGKIKDCLYSLNNNLDDCTHEELNNHLIVNKLPVNGNLYEIFVLDINGRVAGTTNPEEEPGKDFSDDVVFLEGKEKTYVKDFFFDDEFNHIGIAVSAPVMREKKFIGVVVNRIKPGSLYQILLDNTGLEKTGEIYIINKDGYMITPSRFLPEEYTFLKLEVDTENARECLQDLREGIREEEDTGEIFISEGYRGMNVLGVDAPIHEMQWCLLAEISERETLGQLKNELLQIMLTSLIGILVVMAFFILISDYFIKKIVKEAYSGKVMKKNERR